MPEQGEILPGAAAEEPLAGPAAASGEVPVSRAEYEQLKAERDQLVDRLARLQAEFENARKRAERERHEYRDYAAGSVVEQFLPVLDNFELALKSGGSAQQLRHGIELIVKQMEEILRKLHVKPVPTVGEAFDPRLHEALGCGSRRRARPACGRGDSARLPAARAFIASGAGARGAQHETEG